MWVAVSENEKARRVGRGSGAQRSAVAAAVAVALMLAGQAVRADGGAGFPVFPNASTPGGTDGTADEAAGRNGTGVISGSNGNAGGGGAVDLTTGSGGHGGATGIGTNGGVHGTPGATGAVGLRIDAPATVGGTIAGGAGTPGVAQVIGVNTAGGGGGGGAAISATADIVIDASASIQGGTGASNRTAGSGGGGAGVFSTANVQVQAGAQVTGGTGGGNTYPNTNPLSQSHAGGGGGMGVLVRGGGSVTNGGTLTGGAGGDGSSLGLTGGGGDGGAGVQLVDGGTVTNLAGGQVTGGAGGDARVLANGIVPGRGGAGVKGADVTVINAGTITGGWSGNRLSGLAHTPTQASAVEFTGGINTLEIHAGSVLDGNAVAFSGADTLALGGATDSTFDVSAIGAAAQYRGFGIFEKAGASTWTLTGTTSAVSPWTISGGTLSIGTDANLGDTSGALTFNGGTLRNTGAIGTTRAIAVNGAGGVMQTDADFSTSGTVSGSGGLIKTGAGTLTLTGQNTYTGGTTIAAGAVAGSATSFGSGGIVNNAALVLDQAGDGVLANSIGGSGGVTKQGAGQLRLAAANSYAGGTRIAAGTLVGSAASFGSGAIANDTALVVDQPTDAVMANSVSGAGSFTKQGAGRLNLVGTFAMTGPVSIEAGALAVNASLAASPVHVASGATLSGNGTVGATTVRSGGNITPGNSIGTLHVNGTLVQEAGSVYTAELDPASTASDLVAVNGAATLAPGSGLTIAKAQPGFIYSVGTTYTVLSAGGGVSGTYALGGDKALTPFLAWTDTYDANNVYVTVIQTKPIGAVAVTPNEIATAGGANGSVVETPLLNSPTEWAARSALDLLSGSALASTQGALIYDSRYTRELAVDRLRNAFCTVGHTSQDRLTEGGSGAGGCMSNRDSHTVWAQAFGARGRTRGDGNAAGMDRASAGLVVGLDASVSPNWRAGALAGYSRGDFDAESQGAGSESDNYHLGIYGGAQWDRLVLRLGAGYTRHDISSHRTVMLPGSLNALKADYGGKTAQAFGELGYQLQAGNLAIEPFANLAHVNLRTDGFMERGGLAALTSGSSTTNTTFSTLGARVATDVQIGQVPGTLRGTIGWRHAYGDITPRANVFFAGGLPFTVGGVPIAKDAAVVGAGLDLQLSKGATLGLSFEGQFGDDASDRTLRGTLTVVF